MFIISTAFSQELAIEKMQFLKKATQSTEVTQSTKMLRTVEAESIWSDDFSNPNTWTLDRASSCNLDWQIGTGLVNDGPYKSPTITSTTASNGYAMLDSDKYTAANPDDVQSSWITTASPIDLSANQNVVLQFETYFRQFYSKCFVVISTNNTDWPDLNVNFDASTNDNVYELFRGFVPNEDMNENPGLIKLNISPSAGGEEQVWVRFYWTGKGYTWFVDDAAIVKQPNHDIILNFAQNSYFGAQYGRTPFSQLTDSLDIGGDIFNFGSSTQQNVTLEIAIKNASGSDMMNASLSKEGLLTDSSAYLLSTVAVPASLIEGTYTLNATVSSDSTDEDLSNNTYSKDFAITDNIYSLDGIGIYNENISNINEIGSWTDYDGNIVLTRYVIIQETEIVGLEILLSKTTDPGTKIVPFLINAEAVINADFSLNRVPDMFDDRIAENENGVKVEQWNIDKNMIYAPLEGTTLEPGIYYACAELFIEEGEEIHILDDKTAAQNQFASLYFTANNDSLYANGTAAAIRLALDDYVAIEENTPKTFSVHPNPSNGVFTVNFTESNTYKIQVINVLGEIVSAKTVEGTMNETFNMSDYNAGLYFVKVSNGTSEHVQKIIIK